MLAVSGQRELVDLVLRLADDLGIEANSIPMNQGAASDHAPFEMAGVPVLFLYGPDISRINSPQDRLEFIDPQRLGEALLVAKALLRVAGIPAVE